MASITERGPYQIQAVVRRKGYPTQIKTFETRREASDWASVIESEMVRGVFIPRTALEKMTFAQALIKCRKEITIKKRDEVNETNLINILLKNPLALRSLAS